jgi:hypothetical protein
MVVIGDWHDHSILTRAKTLELVERNRVHVLTGPVAAFEVSRPRDLSASTPTAIPSSTSTSGASSGATASS